MSYHIEKEENPATALQRIVREQIESALTEADDCDAAAVHAIRKRIKKIRAALRMVKDQLGPEIFCEENSGLRVVAHCFSEARDATVQLGVLKKLRETTDMPTKSLAKTITLLTRQKQAAINRQSPRQAEARALLVSLGDRLPGWPLGDLTMKSLSQALRKTYRKARECLHCVIDDRTPENFHSFRKHTKNLWYQARIVQHLNSEVLFDICDNAKTLSGHLGDLHDLSFLREQTKTNSRLPKSEIDLIFSLTDQRERQLEEIALALGSRFFAEKPGAFGRRLSRYARFWSQTLSA